MLKMTGSTINGTSSFPRKAAAAPWVAIVVGFGLLLGNAQVVSGHVSKSKTDAGGRQVPLKTSSDPAAATTAQQRAALAGGARRPADLGPPPANPASYSISMDRSSFVEAADSTTVETVGEVLRRRSFEAGQTLADPLWSSEDVDRAVEAFRAGVRFVTSL